MRRSEHLSSTHLGRCRPAGPRQRGLEIFNGWKRARRRERSLLRAVQQSRIQIGLKAAPLSQHLLHCQHLRRG